MNCVAHISNNPSFHQKHLGGLDNSDGSVGSLYPRRENFMLPIMQGMRFIAYLSPVLLARNVVTYAHHQNNTCVALFARTPVIL